ncbi:uncharacterized protein MEPE_00847 [Melanopsichium pennsylvanicum]|uniref:Uncharacterized protein n=1 Tax=Melanopsichium pennsylvanicum TaxID=63383 RepID=A0AAJ5C321_9BASI|nr:uncharacterized protein MEPE_00847 [Melanopsichium pennsylvanicum]
MLYFVTLLALLCFTIIPSVLSIPLPYPHDDVFPIRSFDRKTLADHPQSIPFYACGPTHLGRSTTYWIPISHACRNTSAPERSRLPHTQTGPWDRAWEAWDDVTERLKLFQKRSSDLFFHKRSLVFPRQAGPKLAALVRERIIQHERSTSWWQRLKDWFTKLSGRKVKVTQQQVDIVKARYGRGPQSMDLGGVRITSAFTPRYAGRRAGFGTSGKLTGL